MKPDWKDAPEWANWLTSVDQKDFFWHEDEPYHEFSIEHGERWVSWKRILKANIVIKSIEQRPNSP